MALPTSSDLKVKLCTPRACWAKKRAASAGISAETVTSTATPQTARRGRKGAPWKEKGFGHISGSWSAISAFARRSTSGESCEEEEASAPRPPPSGC